MSEDKSILKSLAVVIVVLAVIAVIISVISVGLVDVNNSVQQKWADEKIISRIKPMGEVATTQQQAASASPEPKKVESVATSGSLTGEQIYNTACMACHSTGAAGAPKVGDVAVWAPRIAQGESVLLTNAIKGFKGMPPRGGSPQLSDEAVRKAVKFMLANSQ